MEEQLLPIVTSGKYVGRPVTELLADEWYINNVLKDEKNKAWFNANNKNWAPIYNIVVNQSITTNKDGKTPEHNKLQNLFLDKINQQKLLTLLFKNNSVEGLNNLVVDENIVRCFGLINIPEFTGNTDNTKIKFEDKFNWDVILYHKDEKTLEIISNLETEISDKLKYKEQYDIDQKEEYKNNLLLIDELINNFADVINRINERENLESEKKLKEHQDKLEKYENELKIYLQQKQQNEKDVEKYESELKTYNTKRVEFIEQKKKVICKELGIDYVKFVNWFDKKDGRLNYDSDTKYTDKERMQLREIVNDKLKPFIEEFGKKNVVPSRVEKLIIPDKPASQTQGMDIKHFFSPTTYITGYDLQYYGNTYELYNKCRKFMKINDYRIYLDNLKKNKEEYKNEYIQKYEIKFEENYKNYRKKYYEDIIKKYCKSNVYVVKENENQYKIEIYLYKYFNEICCEIKPVLSDDYSCVLRKMNAQIKLTKDTKDIELRKHMEKYPGSGLKQRYGEYILIVGSFTSVNVSKEELITIFNQSGIRVIFTYEIFGQLKSLTKEYPDTKQSLNETKLIEENKNITDELLQTKQMLLQYEEKIKKLEERNKQLEEEMQTLKNQKQNKSIKDYFKK